MKLLLVFLGVSLSIAMVVAEPAGARYQVRHGMFWDTKADCSFAPRGFNYVRLHHSHGTFDPTYYDPKVIDALFARLRQDGFNTVRVFINGYVKLKGAIAIKDQQGLAQAYVVNVADFLRRADAQHIGVVLSTDSYPRVSPFIEMADYNKSAFHDENAEILHRANVEARALYLKTFIEALRRADASCLDAVLAYDLQNEWCYVMAPPFTLSNGTVTIGDGRVYTLPGQRQALADDAAVYCIDTLAEAVRAAHPAAPIWVGVFTYNAVGKPGPDDFRIDSAAWKNRLPFRPLAILRSQANVLDLHFYCTNESDLLNDLKSIEFKRVQSEARTRGVVMMVGEFGAFKGGSFTTANAVSEWMATQSSLFGRLGFAGWLYWTYDTHEQDATLWHACSEDGSIYQKLKTQVQMQKPTIRN